eukprot:5269291-Prymnesium_polylepis.1
MTQRSSLPSTARGAALLGDLLMSSEDILPFVFAALARANLLDLLAFGCVAASLQLQLGPFLAALPTASLRFVPTEGRCTQLVRVAHLIKLRMPRLVVLRVGRAVVFPSNIVRSSLRQTHLNLSEPLWQPRASWPEKYAANVLCYSFLTSPASVVRAVLQPTGRVLYGTFHTDSGGRYDEW